jgi:Cu/Ag efflux pump CusA
MTAAPYFINRENVQRKMVVMANVAGRDLKSVVEEMQASVAGGEVAGGLSHRVRRPVRVGGGSLARAAVARLGGGGGHLPAAVCRLPPARDAFLVMLNLPLSIIGGVVGVYLAGGVVTIASIIGFITLFGIATRNGVMMISHIHHLVEHDQAKTVLEAVKRGAEERLIPILMTALAAGLALVPLALSAGQPGSRSRRRWRW